MENLEQYDKHIGEIYKRNNRTETYKVRHFHFSNGKTYVSIEPFNHKAINDITETVEVFFKTYTHLPK
jgi:hypothetical protein